jgi:hypothetical protein
MQRRTGLTNSGNDYISCDSEQQQPQGRFPRPEVRGETDKAGEKLVPLSLLNYVAQSESSQSDSPIELKADGLLLGDLEDKSSRFYHKPDWKRNMSGWRRRRGLYTIESTTEYPWNLDEEEIMAEQAIEPESSVACGNFRRLVEVVGTFTRFMELPTELRTRVYEFVLKFEKPIMPHLCGTTNKLSTKFSDGIDGAKKYTMSSSNQWRFRDDNNMHFEPQFGTEFNRFLQGH